MDWALWAANDGRLAQQINGARQLSAENFELVLKRKQQFVYNMHDKMKDAGVTALVSPLWPHCAPKLKDVQDLGVCLEYAAIWNVTGFPAGVIPITEVREDEQAYEDKFNDKTTRHMRSSCEDSKGMPVSIQVVGHPYEDEKVLGLMAAIESKIGNKVKPVWTNLKN